MPRVFITGASSGLGAGLCLAYAEPGTVLGLVGRRREALEGVAAEAEARGARCHVYVADVCDRAAIRHTIESFSEEAQGIDIAIANAGIGEGRRDEPANAERVGRVLEVNILGLTNTLLPCMSIMTRQGSGTLVGMASVAGYRAVPGSLSYSTSKAAVMTFLEGLEMELSGSGVKTVTLCPGFIRTPLTDRNEFGMPFMLECEDACRRMRNAIDRGKKRYTFPLPMAILAQLMRVAPRWMLMRASPRTRDRARRMV